MLARPNTIETKYIKQLDPSVHPLAFNGFFDDHTSLFHIMDLECKQLTALEQDHLTICTLFYNTNVTPTVIDQYIAQIHECNNKIAKLAIVGIPVGERPVFRLKLVKQEGLGFPYRFFSTVKEANDWLLT